MSIGSIVGFAGGVATGGALIHQASADRVPLSPLAAGIAAGGAGTGLWLATEWGKRVRGPGPRDPVGLLGGFALGLGAAAVGAALIGWSGASRGPASG